MHACAPGVNAMVKLYVLPKDAGQGRAVHPGMLKESILAFGDGTLAARSVRERAWNGWRVTGWHLATAFGATYRTPHRESCRRRLSLDRYPWRGGSPLGSDRRRPLQRRTPTPQEEERRVAWPLTMTSINLTCTDNKTIDDDRNWYLPISPDHTGKPVAARSTVWLRGEERRGSGDQVIRWELMIVQGGVALPIELRQECMVPSLFPV